MLSTMVIEKKLRDLVTAACQGTCTNHIQIREIIYFAVHVTSKYGRWPRKTIENVLRVPKSYAGHSIAIRVFKLELSLEMLKSKPNWLFFGPCDLEIWWMTLQNNRVPLICPFKLCVSFSSHLWIQAGVTFRKYANWSNISVDLCDFDLSSWTLTFCKDITSVNGNNSKQFHDKMREHSENGVTNRPTDRLNHSLDNSRNLVKNIWSVVALRLLMA